MNGGVSEYLISLNIFLSKTLNKVFQIIRDFDCKQGEQIYWGAFLCDMYVWRVVVSSFTVGIPASSGIGGASIGPNQTGLKQI